MTPLEKMLDTLWNYNDTAKSEVIFKDLLSNQIGDQAEILTQLARAQGLQGEFDEAHKTLDEIKHLLKDERIQGALFTRARTCL
jgi:ATP/maltotriose-dependent transcriptional regulator MalT